MPPKAAKKTVEKQKAKIVEDKTFGLKNKKGAKQQKFIQQVQKQVSTKPAQRRDVLDPAAEREKRKEEEKKKKEELAMLFKPVIASQTIAKGVDPKSVVCVFFKQGLCQKGDKCKFSHDLSKDRKGEKRSIYDDGKENDADTMEDWDEEKLEDVINTKHGEDNKQKNATQIVCKYFIEAVENATYGWFWVCPNDKDGGRCIYRHALPPGFQLKKDKKKDDEGDLVSLEAHIETERAALGPQQTKITLESFIAWKKRKIQEKKDKAVEQEEKKKRDFKLGFMNGLTGRDIFTFNPDLIATDDAEAGNDIDYRHRADEEEEEQEEEEQEGAVGVATNEIKPQKVAVRELNESYLASQATEVDNTGTVAASDRFDYIKDLMAKAKAKKSAAKDENNEDDGKLGMACGGGGDDDIEDIEEEDENGEEEEEDEEEDDGTTSKKKNKENNIEIDESLFNVEDLGDIQDELENLDI